MPRTNLGQGHRAKVRVHVLLQPPFLCADIADAALLALGDPQVSESLDRDRTQLAFAVLDASFDARHDLREKLRGLLLLTNVEARRRVRPLTAGVAVADIEFSSARVDRTHRLGSSSSSTGRRTPSATEHNPPGRLIEVDDFPPRCPAYERFEVVDPDPQKTPSFVRAKAVLTHPSLDRAQGDPNHSRGLRARNVQGRIRANLRRGDRPSLEERFELFFEERVQLGTNRRAQGIVEEHRRPACHRSKPPRGLNRPPSIQLRHGRPDLLVVFLARSSTIDLSDGCRRTLQTISPGRLPFLLLAVARS
jgi:hypothetical protein